MAVLFAALLVTLPTTGPVATRARMQLVIGDLPTYSGPLDVKLGEPIREAGYTRTKLTFAVGPTDRVPAWLLVPDAAGKKPAVVCFHQTTTIGKDEPVGLGGKPNLRYAQELAGRGYICLAPDYPSFGEYKFDFRKSGLASGVAKSVGNNRRAIDYLLSRPDVTRVGVIGHSLGGHTALFTAAFDERVSAAVSCCGFCSFRTYKNGNLAGWSSDRYMPRIKTVYGNDPAKLPFEFADVLTCIAPRPVLAVAPERDDNFPAAGVREAIAAALPAFPMGRLRTEYPDAAHDFPPASREGAYRFLDEWVK
jgi:dienelactone hydrolase